MACAELDLSLVLDTLADLVDERDAAAVAELARRRREQRLRVLVVGEAKRGKSTLINALVGRPLLPTGVVPLTAIATTVSDGPDERVDVTFTDGRRAVAAVADLPGLVTERGNPDNGKGVARVVVSTPAPLLAGGVELVDTPGTGSVHEHNTAEATAALEKMDAAVFVVSADPPISAMELRWLGEVRQQAVHVFCVLNKADYLDRTELEQAVTFTQDVVSGELGSRVEIWPVSARAALAAEGGAQAGDGHWRAFHAAFAGYLEDARERDLDLSLVLRAGRLARSVVEESSAVLATLDASEAQLDQRLGAFSVELDRVSSSRFESQALARAGIDRLLGETNQQAVALNAAVAGGLLRDVEAYLTDADGPLRAVEEAWLDFAAARIRAAVEEWRTAHADWLQSQLFELDAQLSERIEGHVRTVRDAAVTLFQFDLTPVPLPARLVAPTRFSFAFTVEVGQTEALAAMVRTHLPGQVGRRAVARHVLARVPVLLDRQIGRARADFADRLRETDRQLRRALDQRFDAGAGRIAEAITFAATHRRDRAEAAAGLRVHHEQRRAAARDLLEALHRKEAALAEVRRDVPA